jgi:molybdate transport system substrate-binding protein
MIMRRFLRPALIALLTVVVLGRLPVPSAHAEPLTVFAAASLKNALDDVATEWKKTGAAPPVTSYASSSVLATQIEHGAPADIFVSADKQWMDYLSKRALVGSPHDLLGNRLALISGADNPLKIAIKPGFALGKALGDGRLSLGDPSNVPAGIYAKEALTKLGVWDSVRSKLAPAADVRAALVLVSRGEAPLGIVYETDAKVDPKVRIVGLFPEDTHTPIRYPVAIVTTSHHPDAGKFIAFLDSPAAKAIFTHYGFEVLGAQ